MLLHLAAGFILACLIAVPALLLGSLSGSGALAAVAVGGCVFAGGGLSWSLLLILFFVTSSALSRLPMQAWRDQISAKSARRDGWQVLANGGVPAFCAALAAVHPSPFWLLGFAGSLASATADTWATEIGRSSRRLPVKITTGEPVPPGTSGGVTPLGLAAALAGSLLLASAGTAAAGSPLLPVLAAGFLGSIVDSVLGATVQETRLCPRCGRATERRIHAPCGCATIAATGRPGINNDAVNALSGAAAGALAILIGALIR